MSCYPLVESLPMPSSTRVVTRYLESTSKVASGLLEDLEKLRVGWVKRINLIKSELRMSGFNPDPSTVGGKIEIGIGSDVVWVSEEAYARHEKDFEAAFEATYKSYSFTVADLSALKKLESSLKRDPEMKEAAQSTTKFLSSLEKLLPDLPTTIRQGRGVFKTIEDGGLLNAGVIDEMRRKLPTLEDDYVSTLEALIQMAMVARKATVVRKPMNYDTMCPGSNSPVNVSIHDVDRGFIPCPYCGQGMKIRNYKEKDDYVRTIPRHKMKGR